MRRMWMLFLVSIISPAAFMAAAGVATAVTVSPAGAITATSAGRLTMTGSGALEISISCRVTLGGTLERTFTTTRGSREGSYTSSRANECTGGSAIFLIEARSAATLDFERILQEAGGLFTGILLTINIIKGQVVVAGVECLYQGPLGMLARLIHLSGNNYREEIPKTILANALSKVSGSALCPERAEVRGILNLSPQQELTF